MERGIYDVDKQRRISRHISKMAYRMLQNAAWSLLIKNEIRDVADVTEENNEYYQAICGYINISILRAD